MALPAAADGARLVRDPLDEERRLEAQRRAVSAHDERRMAARAEALARRAAAESARVPPARRGLARLLGARQVRAALVVARSVLVRRRRPGPAELAGPRAAMGEALWRLRVTQVLALPAAGWLDAARRLMGGPPGRPMTVVLGARRAARTGAGLAVVVHGSPASVARTLRRARGLEGSRTLVIARPGRRPAGAEVVRAALSAGAETVLLLGSPGAASVSWDSARAALDDDPGLAAVSAGRGWSFDHERGAVEPVVADAVAVAVDDAALLLRRSALAGHPPAEEELGAAWALDWSLRLHEHGLRVEALRAAGAPVGALSPEDRRALRARWGPTLRRRVLEDLLDGGGRWCARGLRVALRPGDGALTEAVRALGWTVVAPAQEDVALATAADGGVLAIWPTAPSARGGAVATLPAEAEAEAEAEADAAALAAALRGQVRRPAFRLRIWPRDWPAAEASGDLPLAEGLARALRVLGHHAQVELLGASDPGGEGMDVSLTIRGRRPGPPPAPGQLDLAWLMSHPAEVEDRELERHDAVLVASRPYAAVLAERLRVPVRVFLQCTDPVRFSPQPGRAAAHEILFVGNWRSEFRPIVWDLLPTDADVALYGSGWDLLAPEHARGERVESGLLPALYSSCAILLNDHWEDMRRLGFVSNRILDALACEAFVISDPVAGVEEELDGGVIVYHDRDELRELVGRHLADADGRRAVARRGRAAVLRAHTTAHRARALVQLAEELGKAIPGPDPKSVR